jgi:hypothetical protein
MEVIEPLTWGKICRGFPGLFCEKVADFLGKQMSFRISKWNVNVHQEPEAHIKIS